MGTGLQEYGLVPRAIDMIFEECDKRKTKSDILIKCSFLELHNEDINDLLDPINNGNQNITIREEKGAISIYGLHEETVKNATEMRDCLNKGTVCRTTSSTLMNATSSRSHAIFTITIEQHLINDLYKPSDADKTPEPPEEGDEEFMTAKFHFVDLAGSERMKKTGATGKTMKEGISINKGLLSLGNVIGALTDEKKKTFYVPYRDSKLTRILQDSLGGNSRTVMIACISPADVNFDETLNTLKYASRARNIKNKPIINRDPNSTLIAQLKQQDSSSYD
jgi:Kinesin motor domain